MRSRRRSPVAIGIVAGLVVGSVAAGLVATTNREGSQLATGLRAVTNAAGGGGAGGVDKYTVDCADPRGNPDTGQQGIPIEFPPPGVGSGVEAEITITCRAYRAPTSNRWAIVGGKDGKEISSSFAVVTMSVNSGGPTDRMNLKTKIKSPEGGEMTVELIHAGTGGNFRPASKSNSLFVKFSLKPLNPTPVPKITVDCLDKQYETLGTGDVNIYVRPAFRTAIDVTIKCDPLNDKRWRFVGSGNGPDSVGNDVGRAKFQPDQTTLRWSPSGTKVGTVRAELRPFGNEVFKPNRGDRLNVIFEVRPYTIYALGDSWTAAFGFFGDDASELSIAGLYFCRPGSGVLNDRCSSNSPLGAFKDKDPLTFTGDYGLGNNISWAARTARAVAPKDNYPWVYKNYGVSGSEPIHWQPGGPFNIYAAEAAGQADLTLMTLGGNPALGDVLLGGLWECDNARWKGQLSQCARELINNTYKAVDRLAEVYKSLLKGPQNHVVVSSYMTIVPYLPTNTYAVGEWEGMAREINDAISRAVAKAKSEVSPEAAARLYLVPPLKPATGMSRADDMSGVRCRRGDKNFNSDGSSVLTPQTQDWLTLTQSGLLCGRGAEYRDANGWRAAGQDVWFNPGDAGTHLSRRGNEVLANAAIDFIRANGIAPAP